MVDNKQQLDGQLTVSIFVAHCQAHPSTCPASPRDVTVSHTRVPLRNTVCVSSCMKGIRRVGGLKLGSWTRKTKSRRPKVMDDKELTDQLYQAGSGSCDSKIHVIQPHAMSIAY